MKRIAGMDWADGFIIASAAYQRLCPDADTSIG